MNTKEQVEGVLNAAEESVRSLPDLAEQVQDQVRTWKDSTVVFVRENPGIALLGAFAIGFALAKAARHV